MDQVPHEEQFVRVQDLMILFNGRECNIIACIYNIYIIIHQVEMIEKFGYNEKAL